MINNGYDLTFEITSEDIASSDDPYEMIQRSLTRSGHVTGMLLLGPVGMANMSDGTEKIVALNRNCLEFIHSTNRTPAQLTITFTAKKFT